MKKTAFRARPLLVRRWVLGFLPQGSGGSGLPHRDWQRPAGHQLGNPGAHDHSARWPTPGSAPVPHQGERGSTAAAVELHQAELLKINSLYAQGWCVVSIAKSTVGIGATAETIYLLEKK